MTICTRCVMNDHTDPTITFDENGICNYCTDALIRKKTTYFPGEEGQKKLNTLIASLKEEGKKQDYDCLMGISGGLDSSYLAYLGAVKWGLKILAVHIDDGFDTEISKRNIAHLAKLPNLTMMTVTPDAEQYNELTRAYVLAEVPNIATPQDNILFACIYKTAREHGIRSFLSGGNFALENILQKGNTHDAYDTVNIKAINRQFGRKKINKLPLISPFMRDRYNHGMGIRTYHPLNYIDYNGQRAIDELCQGCGFEYYGSKHHENTLTKVIQTYWFYEKFHVDKRYSHLSSKIISGQMTREEALAELEKPMYDTDVLSGDLAEILPQLDLSQEQFEEIVHRPGKQHTAYRISLYLRIKPYLRACLKSRKNC